MDINYLMQKHVTKGLELSDDYFEDRLKHFNVHFDLIKDHFKQDTKIKLLEVGTGWHPTIPIAFFLNGYTNISTFDIRKLIRFENIQETVRYFIRFHESRTLNSLIPYQQDKINALKEILNQSSSEEELLSALNINYYYSDSIINHFGKDSLNFIFSNNTLEHIFVPVLKQIFKEFQIILDDDYHLMSHFIDMSDHFAHFDSSINIYNFLKYSEQFWSKIDNNIQPQNRLRERDYLNLFEELSYQAGVISHRDGSIEELEKINVDSKFEKYTKEELSVSHTYIKMIFN